MLNDLVLAIDVGSKKCGWAVYSEKMGIDENGSFETITFQHFFDFVDRLLTTWNPQIIVCGKPNRFYSIIANHNKYIGICCLLAEQNNVPLIELNDMSARSAVFPGKGGHKKEQIMELTGISDPDQSDAYVLCKAGYKMGITSNA